ncbi:MAG: YebC/PmpR family DNA-binding transcriptional regulator, partial [Paracoccus sp. (in: a-proteobacteria)]
MQRGAGDVEGVEYIEVYYEGYAPGGVALYVHILTDNRNRTAPEVKKLFEKGGGKLGATGCVSYLFDRKGLFLIACEAVDEEQLMEIALEAGADDFSVQGENFEVTCS